jgi:hypothetical protein
MKKYTAVVSHSDGVITKYLDFDSEDDAKAHVATYGGKVVADLDEDVLYWDVSGDTATKDTDQVAADILAVKWEDIRSRRDNLMAESDWRSMPDSPTMSSAWKTYRQALRDLPASESDPDDIVFPDEPS